MLFGSAAQQPHALPLRHHPHPGITLLEQIIDTLAEVMMHAVLCQDEQRMHWLYSSATHLLA